MATNRLSRRPRMKPSVARCFACALFVLANTTAAQEPVRVAALTESDVVARALRRAPLTDIVQGAVVAEEGRGRAASAYPNPAFTYSREQTFGTFGTREDYLSLSQTIDLGNRRGLYGEAGAVRARAAQREGDVARLSIAADARRRFYDVLYCQLRLTALESWAAHVREALAIVTRREHRGDVAAYDRRRLEREQAVATGRLATEQAALERSRARLSAILGETGVRLSLTGMLLPEADPAAAQALRAASTSRPDFAALNLRVEASSLDRTAASRWWVPDLRLEGGWKGVDLGANGRTDGFLLGASLSLPLWDQSSGLARFAEGEAQADRGRSALLRSELDGELGGARTVAVHLRRAAAEFRDQAHSASGDLVRMTSLGYEGGELSVLELLDAYRGAADDELTALDMQNAARRARIDLDQLTGAGLP